MEIFKTDVLKREFEEFKNRILLEVLDCGLCQISSCENHNRFFIDCNQCRKSWCGPCKFFFSAKQSLLENLDDNGKTYLENFIRDFLNLSDESIKHYYGWTKCISISMYIKAKTFDVKSYHKNRSQVVYKNLDNCKKSNYQIKGMKRSYYKKF